MVTQNLGNPRSLQIFQVLLPWKACPSRFPICLAIRKPSRAKRAEDFTEDVSFVRCKLDKSTRIPWVRGIKLQELEWSMQGAAPTIQL